MKNADMPAISTGAQAVSAESGKLGYTLPCLPGPAIAKKYGPQVEAYGHACAEAARAPLLARVAELEAENTALAESIALGPGVSEVKSASQEIDRLRADLAAKDGEVEALKSALAEARQEIDYRRSKEADIRFAGEQDARDGVHELWTGLDDCVIEVPDDWNEKPLLRFQHEYDPGDDTVGWSSRSAWTLAEDQSGTVLVDLLDQIARPSVNQVNPLAAELEKLRAASVIEWEPGRYYTAAELLRRAIRGITASKRRPLWTQVMHFFYVGSNVGHHLCRWAGRDPDTGKEIAARKGEGSEV